MKRPVRIGAGWVRRDSARETGAEGARLPWRHLHRSIRMAAGQAIAGRSRLCGGAEPLLRTAHGTARIVAQNVVRGIQIACAGNRHVRADAHGRLLVLHPHHAGAAIRHAMPRADPRRGRLGIRRQWRPACHSTANRWCSIRTPRRKATISSASAAWTFPRTAVGCCTARHDWRRTLRFPHP